MSFFNFISFKNGEGLHHAKEVEVGSNTQKKVDTKQRGARAGTHHILKRRRREKQHHTKKREHHTRGDSSFTPKKSRTTQLSTTQKEEMVESNTTQKEKGNHHHISPTVEPMLAPSASTQQSSKNTDTAFDAVAPPKGFLLTTVHKNKCNHSY